MGMMETGFYNRDSLNDAEISITGFPHKRGSDNSVTSKEPEAKKRKLDFELDIKTVNRNGTMLNKDGMPTPGESMEVDMNSDNLEDKKTLSTTGECPCGHLHGSDGGVHHDIHAVGLASVPLLRGPD